MNPMYSALAPAKSHVQRTEHCRREGFDSSTLQGQSGSAVRKACESIRVVDIRTRTKIAWPGGPARSVRPVAPRGSTPAVARAHLPRRESRVGHHARRSHRPAATRLRSAHERDAIPITSQLARYQPSSKLVFQRSIWSSILTAIDRFASVETGLRPNWSNRWAASHVGQSKLERTTGHFEPEPLRR